MGIPLVLRWLWWRFDAWGEIGAIAASAVLAPVLLFAVDNEALRLLAVAFVSTTAAVGISLATRAEAPARLHAFYEQVRPPGFWGPVSGSREARVADARRLYRGLAATATGSLAAFCVLVGAGTAMMGSPAPTWWPGATPSWVGANAVAALLLGAACWKLVPDGRVDAASGATP
jgi:hypothetical protein